MFSDFIQPTWSRSCSGRRRRGTCSPGRTPPPLAETTFSSLWSLHSAARNFPQREFHFLPEFVSDNLFWRIETGRGVFRGARMLLRCVPVWAPVHSTVADSVAFWCQQVRRDAPARCALPNVFTCGMNNTGLAPKRMFLIRPTYGIFILYPVTPEPSLFNGNRRKDLPL